MHLYLPSLLMGMRTKAVPIGVMIILGLILVIPNNQSQTSQRRVIVRGPSIHMVALMADHWTLEPEPEVVRLEEQAMLGGILLLMGQVANRVVALLLQAQGD